MTRGVKADPFEITCLFCKQFFLTKNRNRKYCNITCSHGQNTVCKAIQKKCGICKVEFTSTSHSARRYCSAPCAALARTTLGRSGIRRLLREKQDNKCKVCKRKTWNGKPIPLELDHIDGDSSNEIIKNLRLLCPNCHAQTDTYKGKNKGNGRFFRTQRRLKGKSF